MGNTINREDKRRIPLDISNERVVKNELEIQPKMRVPQSKLWDLQHKFYTNTSSMDWKYNQISSDISSSSYLARSYANLIISYMHDLEVNKPVNKQNRFLILDIGAGHGRFCYLLLNELFSKRNLWPDSKECPFLYVMTDCSQKIIEWWKTNLFFKEYIKNGVLDFAYYDVEKGGQLYLQNTKYIVKSNDFAHPPFIILNNVLSCLRQDVIRISNKGLFPGYISLFSSQHEFSSDNVDIIPRLSIKWSFDETPQKENAFKWETEIRQIVNEYKENNEMITLLIPIMAVTLINRLLDLFHQHCIFCIGDNGIFLPDEIKEVKNPFVQINHDFQLPFHFDFLKRHILSHQGWYKTTSLHESYRTFLCSYGVPAAQLKRVQLTFYQLFISQSNEMIFSITDCLSSQQKTSLTYLISLFRLCQFDHDFLNKTLSFIQSMYSQQILAKVNIHDLLYDLARCQTTVFPVDITSDTCYVIGCFYLFIQEYKKAADMFKQSIQLYGENYLSWFQQGICLYRLHQNEQARFCFYRTLELNYHYDEARVYIERVNAAGFFNETPISHFNETPVEEKPFEIVYYREEEEEEKHMEEKPIEAIPKFEEEEREQLGYYADYTNLDDNISIGSIDDYQREEEAIEVEQHSDEIMTFSDIPSKD